jgi:hypothetical protein
MAEEKLIILVQGHEYLYNLQHNDYDNNLVKDNCWKEIAGELHAQYKGTFTKDTALTENGRVVAGSRQGNGMVCVNRPYTATSILTTNLDLVSSLPNAMYVTCYVA